MEVGKSKIQFSKTKLHPGCFKGGFVFFNLSWCYNQIKRVYSQYKALVLPSDCDLQIQSEKNCLYMWEVASDQRVNSLV